MISREITISDAGSRNSKHWVPRKLTWENLVESLRSVRRGSETHKEYMRMSRDQQAELKDVGGFVGGKIFGGRRLKGTVAFRDIVSLDLDAIEGGKCESVLEKIGALGMAACVYSTRKHAPEAPRLRTLICLSESISPDMYQPVARKLAEMIGIELCDPTTFEINQMMYWPSASADSEYVYRVYDAPLCDPKAILEMYGTDDAWKDVARWPVVPGTEAKIQSTGLKKGEPTEKPGIVGAWCRVHDVYDALETILAGIYTPTDDPNRWTYADGSTCGGAIVHDDGKFLYSYHSTDPIMGQLVNSWELVKAHMFGDLDKDAIIDPKHPNRCPSDKAMRAYAQKDHAVVDDMSRRNLEAAVSDFDSATGEAAQETPVSTDVAWMRELKRDEYGALKPTQEAFIAIMANDPNLQGVRYNELAFAIQLDDTARLPWRRPNGRFWTDNDDAACRNYIANTYHISGKDKVADAITGVASERAFDPIIEWLESLPPWDRVARADTLLIDHMGAPDTEYVRSATSKTLIAAVARQYEPGKKFDTVLTLVGPQGIGKSTLWAKLGGEWFADGLTLTDMRDKTGAEKLQGRWIIEMGELVGMRKAEEEAVKSFLSSKDDWYRAAFGRHAMSHPRRCIIVATTNAESGFLRDITGNRRFWPVTVTGEGWLGSVHDISEAVVKQVWAEALARYRAGETIYLDDEDVWYQAVEAQREATEVDERSGLVQDYLERKLPGVWESMSVNERRAWLANDFGANMGTVTRECVSNIEIWAECFGRDKADMKRTDSYDISRIMASISGWSKRKGPVQRCGPYGVQKVYVRDDAVAQLPSAAKAPGRGKAAVTKK